MGIELLEKRFALMGARAKINQINPDTARWSRERAGINIQNDQRGQFFDIKIGADEQVDYEVIDLRPDLRHLLLLGRRGDGSKEKFLCGHDERHWFVCAVPGKNVSNVISAMESLQPALVRWEVTRNMKRTKNRFTRRNEIFVRQGEWFFIPTSDLIVNPNLIYRNEPISRGRGKSHFCEEVFRGDGVMVMVCPRYPRGITYDVYSRIIKSNPKAQKWNWRMMRRDAAVYARGRVRHSDHKTIVLNDWHRVLMNTENEAPGMRSVVFLD